MNVDGIYAAARHLETHGFVAPKEFQRSRSALLEFSGMQDQGVEMGPTSAGS